MRILIKFIYFIIAFSFFSCGDSLQKKEVAVVKLDEITWSKNIAPIIFKNCTPCHRPGESGAFDLLTYYDAVKKAKLIKFAVDTRYMPPWPADVTYSHFVGERRLDKKEIDLIKLWVDTGTPRGDSVSEPKTPEFYTGSSLGKPDLVLDPGQAVKIKGNGTDMFLIMKYPYRMMHDTLIDFVEFVPDQRKLVHHVNGHLINYDDKRNHNHLEGESVHSDTRTKIVEVYKKMNIPYTDGLQPQFPTLTPNVVYYLPGYTPLSYPEDIGGYKMKKHGAFLLNNIHYGPSAIDTTDMSVINVFFRKTKIKRPITESQMGTFGISRIEPEFIIPPEEVKTFYTHTKINKNISLLSINPHMHLIGSKFLAYATQPNGDTVRLIKINKWDFRWQYYYTFKNPIKLERGATIHVYGTFDNTNKNPSNPFHPPQTITQGTGVESMKTSEEMFQFIFTYIDYKLGDEKIDLEKK